MPCQWSRWLARGPIRSMALPAALGAPPPAARWPVREVEHLQPSGVIHLDTEHAFVHIDEPRVAREGFSRDLSHPAEQRLVRVPSKPPLSLQVLPQEITDPSHCIAHRGKVPCLDFEHQGVQRPVGPPAFVGEEREERLLVRRKTREEGALPLRSSSRSTSSRRRTGFGPYAPRGTGPGPRGARARIDGAGPWRRNARIPCPVQHVRAGVAMGPEWSSRAAGRARVRRRDAPSLRRWSIDRPRKDGSGSGPPVRYLISPQERVEHGTSNSSHQLGASLLQQ